MAATRGQAKQTIKKPIRKAVKTKAAPAAAEPLRVSPELMDEVVHYRGNVPIRSFVGWVLLVLLGVLAVGLLTTQLLISQRQNQLIEETASRVELQGQSRARLVGQWVQGVRDMGDAFASSQVVQLFVAEQAGTLVDAGLRQALVAQTPYMRQALNDFVARNQLEGAFVLSASGNVILADGVVPEALAFNLEAIKRVVETGNGSVLPLRLGKDAVVMDVLRPIAQVSVPGEMAPVVGVLWYSLPVGDRFAELLSTTPLDRVGERSTMVQQTQGSTSSQTMVVGRTALAPLGAAFEDFRQSLASGRALSLSAVDGKAAFATLMPVTGTPLHVLQEYRATDALALMNMYKPGLYLIVTLAVVVLAAFMLAMTIHLMAQRNKTRVKLLGQTMEALVRAVEARDPFLAGHHARVARLCIAVGNRLNLPVGERATLFYAAQMAAVGRLLVPREILMKSNKLTAAERARLEGEIAKSQKILEGLDFDLPIIPVIAQMYERVDGSGYPGGLKSNAISRMARVLGAVDAYAAMTADRSYRKAMSAAAAQKVLGDSGKFDADVVNALKGLK